MAQNHLKSVIEIFESRLYRIPDYQRGYAWEKAQLIDFWEDVSNLQPNKPHYTGVITLEEVNSEKSKKWEDEYWIVEKGYKSYYVVDGQQRLTTIIIMIQCILEQITDEQTLNHDEKSDIRKKYICQIKAGGISKAYLYGYEKDNPSYEFLKTRIFSEESNSNQGIETYIQRIYLMQNNFLRIKLKIWILLNWKSFSVKLPCS